MVYGKIAAFLSAAALALVSCSDKGSSDEEYSAVITFEQAQLAPATGVAANYSDVLWGMERAGDIAGGKEFDDIIYSEEGVGFGSYYSYTQWESWGGFAISSNLETEYSEDYTGQFNVHASSAGKFAVAYYSAWEGSTAAFDRPTIVFDAPQTVLSALVANSNYTYSYCTNHPAVGPQEEPVSLKVTAEGYLGGQATGRTAEFTLACGADVLGGWKRVSFKSLGSADRIVFTVVSNDPMAPLYFCMDDLRLR